MVGLKIVRLPHGGFVVSAVGDVLGPLEMMAAFTSLAEAVAFVEKSMTEKPSDG